MIVLFSGVSGVGKTDISRHIAAKYNWKFITTFTTRASRFGETEKITLSADDFTLMECSNAFFCVDDYYGHKYGLLAADVESAVSDSQGMWMIDRPVWKLDTFHDIPHLHVILLPESSQQLVQQLKSAGREARTNEVLLDYKINYLKFYGDYSQICNRIIVVNATGAVYSSAETIVSWANKQKLQVTNAE